MYKLQLTCGNHSTSLGILVPISEVFGLDTRLSVRQAGEGDMDFQLIPKEEELSGTFIPICPEEPFAYISRLKDSFLCIQDSQPGILIKETQE